MDKHDIEDPQSIAAFDMYFASIRSMQFHPGAGTREHVKLTARECADAALEMLGIRNEIMKRGTQSCRGE
jgi:hypothetical protein